MIAVAGSPRPGSSAAALPRAVVAEGHGAAVHDGLRAVSLVRVQPSAAPPNQLAAAPSASLGR